MSINAENTCQVTMANGKPCGRSFHIIYEKLCIFHYKKEEGYWNEALNVEFKRELTQKIEQESNNPNISEIDFSNYEFPEYSFKDFEFKKSVNFTNAIFKDKVSFRATKFLGSQNKFIEAKFKGTETDFNLAQFKGYMTDFSEARFDGDTNFYLAQFSSEVTRFNVAVFNASTTFSNAFFYRNSYFLKTHFNGKRLVFENTHFVGEKTSFFESTFESIETEFTNTIFEGDTSFDYCVFKNNIRFSGKQHAYVALAFLDKLPAGISLRNDLDSSIEYHENLSLFSKVLELTEEEKDHQLRKSNDTAFQNAIGDLYRRSHARMFLGTVSMRELRCHDATLIQFQHVNLSRVQFRGSFLRNIQFIDVIWNEEKRMRFWIPILDKFHALIDEKVALSKKPFDLSEIELVRHAYRQLKQNYEDNRNYYVADDFYFGEMEMARMKNTKWWKRHLLSWQVLYRWSSGYGQQWENSLFLIALLFLGLPLISLVTGLQYLYLNQPYPADYWHALQYNFLTVTFQKEISEFYKPEPLTRNIAIVESLIIPILATLFVMALRRRFKR